MCASQYTLNEDGKTCKYPEDFILINQEKKVFRILLPSTPFSSSSKPPQQPQQQPQKPPQTPHQPPSQQPKKPPQQPPQQPPSSTQLAFLRHSKHTKCILFHQPTFTHISVKQRTIIATNHDNDRGHGDDDDDEDDEGDDEGFRMVPRNNLWKTKVLYRNHSASIFDAALDPLSDLIYYTDVTCNCIQALRLDASQHLGQVVKGGQPRYITVAARAGFLFWTNKGKTPRIERSLLDGTSKVHLFKTGFGRLGPIQVDYNHNHNNKNNKYENKKNHGDNHKNKKNKKNNNNNKKKNNTIKMNKVRMYDYGDNHYGVSNGYNEVSDDDDVTGDDDDDVYIDDKIGVDYRIEDDDVMNGDYDDGYDDDYDDDDYGGEDGDYEFNLYPSGRRNRRSGGMRKLNREARGTEIQTRINRRTNGEVNRRTKRDTEKRREEGKLFWVDLELRRIESADLDGANRHVIVRDMGEGLATGLALIGRWLLWATEEGVVEKVDKRSGGGREVFWRGDDVINMMTSPSKQAGGRCPRNRCSHFCLSENDGDDGGDNGDDGDDNGGGGDDDGGDDDNEWRCSCPLGMHLKEDGRECRLPVQCASNKFQCVSDGLCIHQEWRCDRHADCIDKSDEAGCRNCSRGACERGCEGGFECKRGGCVDKRVVCDGKVDCTDGSDEDGCSLIEASKSADSNDFTSASYVVGLGLSAVAVVVGSAITLLIFVCRRKSRKLTTASADDVVMVANATSPSFSLPDSNRQLLFAGGEDCQCASSQQESTFTHLSPAFHVADGSSCYDRGRLTGASSTTGSVLTRPLFDPPPSLISEASLNYSSPQQSSDHHSHKKRKRRRKRQQQQASCGSSSTEEVGVIRPPPPTPLSGMGGSYKTSVDGSDFQSPSIHYPSYPPSIHHPSYPPPPPSSFRCLTEEDEDDLEDEI